MKYPRGFRKHSGTVQVAIRFPEPFFNQVLAMAKKEKKSFNVMVMELCKLGKFDLDESDKLEEPPTENEKAA